MLNLITIAVLSLWGMIELAGPLSKAAARAELRRPEPQDHDKY